ncbi:hypothetical protein STEG23_022414, partial [Scotinomys teguina]
SLRYTHVCVYVYIHVLGIACMQHQSRTEEGVGSPVPGAADACELPCGCTELYLYLCPMEEHICMPIACEGQKRKSDPLELELKMSVCRDVMCIRTSLIFNAENSHSLDMPNFAHADF